MLSGLLVDLVGYTEEEAVQLLGAELPGQIADNTTYTAAIYLGIAFENTGCTADIYYKDEHIIFDEEVPQIFDEAGALTEEAVKVFEEYDIKKVRKERKDIFLDWLNEYAEA